MTRPLGLMLAGGQARRMGGGDKALRRVGGIPVVERIEQCLRPQCADFAVSAEGDPARWAPYTSLVLADAADERAGPLAGALAGLRYLEGAGRPDALLLTVPGDGPFLPGDLVDRLSQARLRAGAATAIAASGGRLHPVAALWPVTVRSLLETAIGEGLRGVLAFHARVGYATAIWPIEPVDPFFNINSPEDLREAEALVRLFGS